MMVDKDDLKRIALDLPGVAEKRAGSYEFYRDGRMMAVPYPERVHPKRPRVRRDDMFVVRVADADDKEALLSGEPDVFFTTRRITMTGTRPSSSASTRLIRTDWPRSFMRRGRPHHGARSSAGECSVWDHTGRASM